MNDIWKLFLKAICYFFIGMLLGNGGIGFGNYRYWVILTLIILIDILSQFTGDKN